MAFRVKVEVSFYVEHFHGLVRRLVMGLENHGLGRNNAWFSSRAFLSYNICCSLLLSACVCTSLFYAIAKAIPVLYRMPKQAPRRQRTQSWLRYDAKSAKPTLKTRPLEHYERDPTPHDHTSWASSP